MITRLFSNHIVILTGIALVLLASSCCLPTSKDMCDSLDVIVDTKLTGWEKDGLTGKVKESTAMYYEIKNIDGKDIKELTDKQIAKYDVNGYKIGSSFFTANNIQTQKTTSWHNDKGNLFEETTCLADGTFISKTICETDDNGHVIKSSGSGYMSTKMSYTVAYKYDNRGLLGEREDYKDGILTSKTIYQYDKNGKEIEEEEHDPNGSKILKRLYKHDDKGRLIELRRVEGDDKLIIKMIFKYDNIGNLNERLEYNSNGTLTEIAIFTYTYY